MKKKNRLAFGMISMKNDKKSYQNVQFQKSDKIKKMKKSKSIHKIENPVSKVLFDYLLKFNFKFQIQILCRKKSNFQEKIRKT